MEQVVTIPDDSAGPPRCISAPLVRLACISVARRFVFLRWDQRRDCRKFAIGDAHTRKHTYTHGVVAIVLLELLEKYRDYAPSSRQHM